MNKENTSTNYKILHHEDDWKWYKKEIDCDDQIEYTHIGDPVNFPCGVFSKLNGDYYPECEYLHFFVYSQSVVCDKCDNLMFVWPDLVGLEEFIND